MADLGATPVYVVNMPPGGFNNGGNPPDIPDVNDQKNPGKKKFSFGKLLQGAFFYPAVDYTADSLIGDTAFGQWAKNTTLGDLGNSAFNMLAPEGVTASPRPDNLAASLDITMHYDRPPTIRAKDVAPGMTVRVDNGPSLMP